MQDVEMRLCHWCKETQTDGMLQVGMIRYTPETVTLHPGSPIPRVHHHLNATVAQPCCAACAQDLMAGWCRSTLVRTMHHDKHPDYLPMEQRHQGE